MQSETTPRAGVRTVVVPALPTRAPSAREPALKVYDILLAVLGVVGAAVSGWSIATLLHDEGGMPWYLAGLGVGVYDLLAFMAGLMVYIRRHEPHRAVGAQVLMLAAVAGSAYVNYMHGRQIGGDLVALLLGAAPVVFEVAFAMRHNVLTLVTAVLFRRAMWARYKDGVWIKLHTGSLPESSGGLPEVPEDDPEALRKSAVDRIALALDLPPELVDAGSASPWSPPPGGGFDPAWVEARHREATSEAVRSLAPADSPESAGNLPVTVEERAEAVAEALRKGERITGETVGSLYGVSDRTGRDYIRRAKAINAALAAGSEQ